MFIELPVDVEKIINTLEDNGYEAYAVGGCVRDSILGRTPNDWDITTSAKPMETKALFKRTFDTGIQHGTVSVLLGGSIYEVTTYRIDGEYEDARHPKEVTFTANLKEDLLRRDFTINAMAYNPKRGLVDMYGGLSDIENKVIRCVGDPFERFSEDALRILRAVRFASQLGYSIDKGTEEAIIKLAPTLSKISAERIQAEFVKILVSNNPGILRDAYKYKITGVILPELDKAFETTQNNPHHAYTVGEHTMRVLENIRPDKVLRLSALFHDLGKAETKTTDEDGIDHFKHHAKVGRNIARDVLHRLKFDNDTIDLVTDFVLYHEKRIETDKRALRRFMNEAGEVLFPDMFELNEADVLAQSDFERDLKLKRIESLRTLYKEIKDAGDCVTLKDLAVKGKDLIDAGVKPGPAMGEILNTMLEAVLDDPSKNNKEDLMRLI